MLPDSKRNISKEIVFSPESVKNDFENIKPLIDYLFKEEKYQYLGESFKKSPKKNKENTENTEDTNKTENTEKKKNLEDVCKRSLQDTKNRDTIGTTENKKTTGNTETLKNTVDTSMGDKSWIRFINTNIEKVSKKMQEEEEEKSSSEKQETCLTKQKKAHYGSASYRQNHVLSIKKLNFSFSPA